jgi:hypothetical protein
VLAGGGAVRRPVTPTRGGRRIPTRAGRRAGATGTPAVVRRPGQRTTLRRTAGTGGPVRRSRTAGRTRMAPRTRTASRRPRPREIRMACRLIRCRAPTGGANRPGRIPLRRRVAGRRAGSIRLRTGTRPCRRPPGSRLRRADTVIPGSSPAGKACPGSRLVTGVRAQRRIGTAVPAGGRRGSGRTPRPPGVTGLRAMGPRGTGLRETGPRGTGPRETGLRETGPRETGDRGRAGAPLLPGRRGGRARNRSGDMAPDRLGDAIARSRTGTTRGRRTGSAA